MNIDPSTAADPTAALAKPTDAIFSLERKMIRSVFIHTNVGFQNRVVNVAVRAQKLLDRSDSDRWVLGPGRLHLLPMLHHALAWLERLIQRLDTEPLDTPHVVEYDGPPLGRVRLWLQNEPPEDRAELAVPTANVVGWQPFAELESTGTQVGCFDQSAGRPTGPVADTGERQEVFELPNVIADPLPIPDRFATLRGSSGPEHPHLLPIFEKRYALWCTGGSLETCHAHYTASELSGILAGACQGLDQLHRRGRVHGAIGPDKIYVTVYGNGREPVGLLDPIGTTVDVVERSCLNDCRQLARQGRHGQAPFSDAACSL